MKKIKESVFEVIKLIGFIVSCAIGAMIAVIACEIGIEIKK